MLAVNWTRNSRTVETVGLRGHKVYRVFGDFGIFGEASLQIQFESIIVYSNIKFNVICTCPGIFSASVYPIRKDFHVLPSAGLSANCNMKLFENKLGKRPNVCRCTFIIAFVVVYFYFHFAISLRAVADRNSSFNRAKSEMLRLRISSVSKAMDTGR